MKYALAILMAIVPALNFGCSKTHNTTEDARFTDKRVVMQVNDNKLTLGEIQKRYATIKFESAQQEYDLKKGFAEQFLQRFLLIEGAKENQISAELDTMLIKRSLLQNLYNQKIMSKINVTDADVNDFFRKYGGEVEVGQIIVSDSLLADSLFLALTKGSDFEQLARSYSKDQISAAKGGVMGYFGYGKLNDKVQEAAFSMKPGEFSRPINTRTGWLIIKIYDRNKNTQDDLEKNKDSYQGMASQYLQKTSVDKYVDEARVQVHYQKIEPTIQMMIQKADSVKAAGNKPANLPSSAYLDPASFTDGQRKMLLVQFDGGGTTVGDYLDLMKGYAPERSPELRNTSVVDEILEGMTMPAILERTARSEGIDQTEEFKNGIEYLKGSLLAQKMTDKIYSTLGEISNAEIKKYYDEHIDQFNMPDQIRASAIALKTKEEAETLLQRIKNGAGFIQEAKKYSIDKKSGVDGGDLGFFTEDRNTPIYQASENLKKGELGGPVEMDGNWWIFMVTDRVAKQPKTLNLVEPDITSLIGQERRAKALSDFIEDMKEKTHYSMDLDLIRNNLFMGPLTQTGKETK